MRPASATGISATPTTAARDLCGVTTRKSCSTWHRTGCTPCPSPSELASKRDVRHASPNAATSRRRRSSGARTMSPLTGDRARTHLGPAASRVKWIEGDVLAADLGTAVFDVWHDRAVFHFLTSAGDRRRYTEQVRRAVKPGVTSSSRHLPKTV